MKKDSRAHPNKLPREVALAGGNTSNSSSPMVRTSKQNSSSNHKKKVMPSDDKLVSSASAPTAVMTTTDSRPQKKQKVDGGPTSLSFSEWKERQEKEKLMQQQRRKEIVDPKMKVLPPGGGDGQQIMADKARYHHSDKHQRQEQKSSVQHRDRNYVDRENVQHQQQGPPPYSKNRSSSDRYQMMKHLNESLESGDRVPRSEEKPKQERSLQKLNTADVHKFPVANDVRRRESIRVPAPQWSDEMRMKPSSPNLPQINSQNVNADLIKPTPHSTELNPPSEQLNASDKLFDDLISASVPKLPPRNIQLTHSSASMHDRLKEENINSGNLNVNIHNPDLSSQNRKHDINLNTQQLVTDTMPTNGEGVSNVQQMPQKVSPQKRCSSTGGQKAPQAIECRRSSRHRTPLIASPVENKLISPVKEQPNSAEILNDNSLQPIVKITRIEMEKPGYDPIHDATPEAKPKVGRETVDPQHHDVVPTFDFRIKSPDIEFAQSSADIPKVDKTNMPDRNLDPEPMDIVPISKHSDKSRKERHDRRKASKKEKHRHKHSHLDSHRERNHGIKLSISKDKIGIGDERRRGSPTVESGGGLKLKFSKGRLTTDVIPETNDSNSSLAVPSTGSGGSLKLVIPKSKLINSSDNSSNGNSSREQRRKDKSPRSHHSKSPKSSAQRNLPVPDDEVNAMMQQPNYSQQSNPYFMPPVSSINQQMGSYAYAQQYCPAPAAIHPATTASVRPPQYPGYAMYGPSYQQQQSSLPRPPLPPCPPPPPPPPPSK